MIEISTAIDMILHIDQYLSLLIQNYNLWSYAILFLIIFIETGLVITPILPGDSLLFAAGSFAALGALNIAWLLGIMILAAVLGDTLNYSIGAYMGQKVFKKEDAHFLKKEYLQRTKEFYNKHGKKTIILARFVPIIRTFAPFIAGIGKMKYSEFLRYNIIGGVLWVSLFLLGGYYFGTIPTVQENFSLVLIGIILISILPMIREYIKSRKENTTTVLK